MDTVIASYRVMVRGQVPRKNRRHIIALRPHPRLVNSPEFNDFTERLDAAWRTAGHPVIRSGRWRLLVESRWSRVRHLDVDVADGDVDAPLSAVLDAMQESKLLDNDARVVELGAVKDGGYGDEQCVVLTLEVCDA